MAESALPKEGQTEKEPAMFPHPNHKDDVEDEDENVQQLGDCSALYMSLQDCLVETNRNWKACQSKVQALKACNQRRMNNREK
ncbi:unnamed protein product [Rhodiola kirilowii]